MSLTLALNNALTGLNVSQRSLAVLSQNIANANTQGYSRKTLEQSATVLDGNGAGVSVQDVSRKIDEFLQTAVQLQTSDLGKAQTTNDFLDKVQVYLGKPGSGNSLDTSLTSFFSDVQQLAETPERASFQVNAVNSGAALAQQFHDLAQGLQDVRFEADQQIHTAVLNANEDLKSIYTLNNSISSARALGQSTSELEDKRDNFIRDLASYLDIKVNKLDQGRIGITTPSGLTLLDDSQYQLSYSSLSSVNELIYDSPRRPVTVQRVASTASDGIQELISGGAPGTITSRLISGKLKALVDLREKSIPDILAQVDTLAANLRDNVNAIHNDGSAYPPINSYTGTRPITVDQENQWSGKVRIAVLDGQGKPVPSVYSDEAGGARPLTLDLSNLNNGFGNGKTNIQTIIDEINSNLTPAGNKAELGNLNNIRLVSDTRYLPTSNNQFSFDFDLENISGSNSKFFFTDAQVFDNTGANITSTNDHNTVPSLDIASTGSYTTVAGSKTVSIKTTSTQGLKNGDRVYLPDPGADINGIAHADLAGYFEVSNVTTAGFEINVRTAAGPGPAADVSGKKVRLAYGDVPAGEQARTRDNGLVTVDFSNNPNSTFYTIKANVAVDDGKGNFTQGTISYQVYNNTVNTLNDRYSATGVGGSAKLVLPNGNPPYARAILVDAQGQELPKTNGVYVATQKGYLKIIAGSSNYGLAIDELDSKQEGVVIDNITQPGTNRGFSHYFELNNFFQSNQPTDTGDTIKGSAFSMAVTTRLKNNPAGISLGVMSLSQQPADPSAAPLYTYERSIGDNTTIQKLGALSTRSMTFTAAGGFAQSNQTLGSYSAEILGYASANAVAAQNAEKNTQTTLDGFQQRSDAVSGVNLDEELANTVIYQNAYTASARIITVTSELFDKLLTATGA